MLVDFLLRQLPLSMFPSSFLLLLLPFSKAYLDFVVILLLSGAPNKRCVLLQLSYTSRLYFQIIHLNGFTEKEIEIFISSARGNIIDSMMTLVRAMDSLGIIFENSISVRHSDRLSELSSTYKQKGKVSSLSELKTILIQLWNDGGIQRCFCRRHEFQLIDSAEYFFAKVRNQAIMTQLSNCHFCFQVDEVMSEDYHPSMEDILKTRIVTSGVSEIHFTIGVSVFQFPFEKHKSHFPFLSEQFPSIVLKLSL